MLARVSAFCLERAGGRVGESAAYLTCNPIQTHSKRTVVLPFWGAPCCFGGESCKNVTLVTCNHHIAAV